MKKSMIIFLMLVLLSAQFVLAIDFEVKDSYSQGETLITKLSGNFVSPVTKDNVFFYKGHVRAPMVYDIVRINEDYYIYALLDQAPENYSIVIEGAEYMVGKSIVDDDIIKNFTITGETADFSVEPGFVVTENNFYLEVQNLQPTQITINVETSSNLSDEREIFVETKKTYESSFSLKSGEIKKINFLLGNGNVSFQTIKLYTTGETIVEEGSCFFWQNCTNVTTIESTNYEIPVYISKATAKDNDGILILEPSEIESTYLTNNRIERVIYLYNTGNDYVRNISFYLSESLVPYITILQNTIVYMEPNTNIPINISIFSYLETSQLQGTLEVRANNNISTDVLLLITFTNNQTEVSENQSSALKTCAELGAVICNTKVEKCDKEPPIYATDTVCCSGTCVKIKKSSAGIIIAIIMLIGIVGGLVWFYFNKYKKPRKPVDLLKIAKGKNSSPGLPPRF